MPYTLTNLENNLEIKPYQEQIPEQPEQSSDDKSNEIKKKTLSTLPEGILEQSLVIICSLEKLR